MVRAGSPPHLPCGSCGRSQTRAPLAIKAVHQQELPVQLEHILGGGNKSGRLRGGGVDETGPERIQVR
jgi:hypothetical protein